VGRRGGEQKKTGIIHTRKRGRKNGRENKSNTKIMGTIAEPRDKKRKGKTTVQGKIVLKSAWSK